MDPRMDPKRQINCSPLKANPSKKAKVDATDGGEIDNVIEIDNASSTGVEIDNAMAGGSPPGWFCAFFEKFEARFEDKIDSLLCKRLEELTTKVNDHEDKITGLQIEIEDLQKQVVSLKKEEQSLKLLVDDLENRSRRNNLVFHGIPEAEGSGAGRRVLKTATTQSKRSCNLSVCRHLTILSKGCTGPRVPILLLRQIPVNVKMPGLPDHVSCMSVSHPSSRRKW